MVFLFIVTQVRWYLELDGVDLARLGVQGLVFSVPGYVEFASGIGADLDCGGLAVLPGKLFQDESSAALQSLDGTVFPYRRQGG